MKNYLIALGVIALVLLGGYAFMSYTTGEGERAGVSQITGNSVLIFNGDKQSIVKEESSYEFEGYSVAKSHIGTFDNWEANVYVDSGKIEGFEAVIKADSVNTGISKLNDHLRSPDFFEVEKYPEITFVANKINNGQATGILTFRGISKEITFPVSVAEESISSEFYLDTTPFEMKYAGVNKEVRIKFSISY